MNVFSTITFLKVREEADICMNQTERRKSKKMKNYMTTEKASFYRRDDGKQEISIDVVNPRIIDLILEALKADTFKAAEDGKYAEVVENAEYINDITAMYSNWDKGKGATTNE